MTTTKAKKPAAKAAPKKPAVPKKPAAPKTSAAAAKPGPSKKVVAPKVEQKVVAPKPPKAEKEECVLYTIRLQPRLVQALKDKGAKDGTTHAAAARSIIEAHFKKGA